MSYDLWGSRRTFTMSSTGWCNLYDLAIESGWAPLETTHDDWPYPLIGGFGEYFGNNGQIVGEDDARNLAQAIQKALLTIPDDDIAEKHAWRVEVPGGVTSDNDANKVGGKLVPCLETGKTLLEFENMEEDTTPIAYWSGIQSKTRLRDFIAFCREGAFRIL